MKIFKNPQLVKFVEFGPKFREPVSFDSDKVYSHCIKICEFLKKWFNFDGIPLSVLMVGLINLKYYYSVLYLILSVDIIIRRNFHPFIMTRKYQNV